MKAFVIGSPIQQSLSPAIFYYLGYQLKLNLDYQKKEIKPQELDSFLSELKLGKDILGSHVTLPLKELLPEKLDVLSEEAQFIGAVNVISCESGKLKGYNTDIVGIQKTLERYQLDLKDKEALVFGAGGSARALLYVLGGLQLKSVFIFNPRSSRGEELAREAQKKFPHTTFKEVKNLHDIHSSLSLVVNTTPVGMSGTSSTDLFKLLKDLAFEKNTLAFDFVYSPAQTPFMELAKNLQLKTTNGLDMLIDQALGTWPIWKPESGSIFNFHEDLKRYLNQVLVFKNDKRPLALMGFMGSGKTSVGKVLGTLSGKEFIDIDEAIEKSLGMSVSEIFEKKGEAFFRQEEKKVIEEALKKSRSVIALGGGSIVDQESLELILKTAQTVYLQTSVEKVFERLKGQGQTRPLLKGLGPVEQKNKISELMNLRKEAYARAAIKLDTSESSIEDLIIKLFSQLSEMK